MDKNSISKRKGKVSIHLDLLESMEFTALSKIFCRFFPFAIDNTMVFFERSSMYYGYSDMFDEIQEGEVIPQYVIEVTMQGDGTFLIEANKV